MNLGLMPVISKQSACGADCEAGVAPICLKFGLCFCLLVIKRLYQGISMKVIFEEVLAFLRLLIVGFSTRMPVISKRSACGADCEARIAPICLKIGLCFRLLVIKRLYQGISIKVIFEEMLAFLRFLIVSFSTRMPVIAKRIAS